MPAAEEAVGPMPALAAPRAPAVTDGEAALESVAVTTLEGKMSKQLCDLHGRQTYATAVDSGTIAEAEDATAAVEADADAVELAAGRAARWAAVKQELSELGWTVI